MEARKFLQIDPVDGDLHWQLVARPEICTPGNFLFGGCGLAAGLVALETASGRPTVWATAQYLSYAPGGSTVDYLVDLSVVGGHITQGRAVARVEGEEILTVNAALGTPQVDINEVWVEPPSVPAPEDCPVRMVPKLFANSILDSVEVRLAAGRVFTDLDGTPGERCSAMWARLPGQIDVSAASLAIFGDYVSGAVSQPLGQRTMGRSLDNTLRMVQLAATEWVLCDIRMDAVVDGYAQGTAYLWSHDGVLLATASQSLSIRFWPEDLSIDI